LGIVLVLASLLFPVFGKMKQSEQNVRCLGNLRALSQVCLKYANDNNGRMPQGNVGQGSLYWFDQLCAYEGSGDRYTMLNYMGCPAARSTGWRTVNGSRPYDINYRCGWSNQPPHTYINYGFLHHIDAGFTAPPTGGLSKAAWFMDPRTDNLAHFDYRVAATTPFRRDHNKKTNVLFFDGHAAAVEIPDFNQSPNLLTQPEWIDFFGAP
jgi:prepilin-type processing-associated H-X9-DG protein